jgi:uncharacterized membrane protein YeaQ/YmgE (transglycosylase-associated protein family)
MQIDAGQQVAAQDRVAIAFTSREARMSVFYWIIIGLVAGWLATQILGGRGGLLYNLAVGLVGAIVGGFLFEKLNLVVMPDFWGNLITATIGAIVFLLIWRAIRGR